MKKRGRRNTISRARSRRSKVTHRTRTWTRSRAPAGNRRLRNNSQKRRHNRNGGRSKSLGGGCCPKPGEKYRDTVQNYNFEVTRVQTLDSDNGWVYGKVLPDSYEDPAYKEWETGMTPIHCSRFTHSHNGKLQFQILETNNAVTKGGRRRGYTET